MFEIAASCEYNRLNWDTYFKLYNRVCDESNEYFYDKYIGVELLEPSELEKVIVQSPFLCMNKGVLVNFRVQLYAQNATLSLQSVPCKDLDRHHWKEIPKNVENLISMDIYGY